jgi:hypothetical protein
VTNRSRSQHLIQASARPQLIRRAAWFRIIAAGATLNEEPHA